MTATTPKNRRNRKAQDMAEATELKDILNEEPEKTVTEAAEYVGTTEVQLLEMFCERLSDGSVLAWHTVPTEHEPLLDEFKNLVDAENSVRRLDAPSEPATLQDLMEEIAPALGKLDEGTQEVIQTSWVNGLHIDLSHLENLLNSKD